MSKALRGCVLIELAWRGHIGLEARQAERRQCLSERKLIVKSGASTGDTLLDQALKHLSERDGVDTTESWLKYLAGEGWNPLKLKYQLKNVREQLAKGLAQKSAASKRSVSIVNSENCLYIDMTLKQSLISRIQIGLLFRWCKDARRIDERLIALLFMAHFSNALDDVFWSLRDEERKLVNKRLKWLFRLNPDHECDKITTPSSTISVIWALVAAFNLK
jgi:golgi phosphoprotein 3